MYGWKESSAGGKISVPYCYRTFEHLAFPFLISKAAEFEGGTPEELMHYTLMRLYSHYIHSFTLEDLEEAKADRAIALSTVDDELVTFTESIHVPQQQSTTPRESRHPRRRHRFPLRFRR